MILTVNCLSVMEGNLLGRLWMGSAIYNELWKANVYITCSGGTGGKGMGCQGRFYGFMAVAHSH